MDYEIVVSETIKGLEEEVNIKLSEGWVLAGNVFHVQKTEEDPYDYGFYQPMTIQR